MDVLGSQGWVSCGRLLVVGPPLYLFPPLRLETSVGLSWNPACAHGGGGSRCPGREHCHRTDARAPAGRRASKPRL
eukprot:795450-Pyramimonas_sp.AAC.1